MMMKESCTVQCKFGASGHCNECCYETEMPLTQIDIEKIVSLGYDVKEFTRELHGLRVLKNINGRCFFLKNNKCSIYDFRPQGCRLYPLVYDVSNNMIKIDIECPHREEFKHHELEYTFDCLIALVKELLNKSE